MFSVRAGGRRRGAAASVGAIVALVLLTGCQADAGPSANETPDPPSSSAATPAETSTSASASSSPESSPASSVGPAADLPVPVKPALADENSKEGLEAFTRYWFELFSYGYETNDWAPFEAVTDPGCRTCNKYVDIVKEIYGEGQYIEGGQFVLHAFQTDFAVNTQGSIQAFVNNGQSDITFYGSSGALIRTDQAPKPVVDAIFAVYLNGEWKLLDYGRPEGT